MSFISEMRTQLKRTAEDFALGANRHGWELDFSSASLSTLDHMLDEMLDVFPPGRAYRTWPDAQMPPPAGNVIVGAVAYLGEVTIRSRDGEWIANPRWGVVIQLPGAEGSFIPQLAVAHRTSRVPLTRFRAEGASA